MIIWMSIWVQDYVLASVCICVRTCVSLCPFVSACAYECIRVYLCENVSVCLCVYVFLCVSVCLLVHVLVCVNVCIPRVCKNFCFLLYIDKLLAGKEFHAQWNATKGWASFLYLNLLTAFIHTLKNNRYKKCSGCLPTRRYG